MFVYVHMRVCLYVCVCVYTRVCVCVCIYTRMCVCVYILSLLQPSTYFRCPSSPSESLSTVKTKKNRPPLTCTCLYVYTHTDTQTHKRTHNANIYNVSVCGCWRLLHPWITWMVVCMHNTHSHWTHACIHHTLTFDSCMHTFHIWLMQTSHTHAYCMQTPHTFTFDTTHVHIWHDACACITHTHIWLILAHLPLILIKDIYQYGGMYVCMYASTFTFDKYQIPNIKSRRIFPSS